MMMIFLVRRGGAASFHRLSAVAAPRSLGALTNRAWPTTEELSPARSKFRSVLEDYRQHNYGQTLFSRFIKEMINATDANHDGKITRSEFLGMLKNIGVTDKLTADDVDAVMNELGKMDEELKEKVVYNDQIEQILLKTDRPSSMAA